MGALVVGQKRAKFGVGVLVVSRVVSDNLVEVRWLTGSNADLGSIEEPDDLRFPAGYDAGSPSCFSGPGWLVLA